MFKTSDVLFMFSSDSVAEMEKLLMHFWIDQLQMSKRSGVQCWLWWACTQLCTAVCRPATADISLRVSCLSGCVGTKIEWLNAARLHVGLIVHLWCVLVLCSYRRFFLTYCWQQNLPVYLSYFLLGLFLSKKLVQIIFLYCNQTWWCLKVIPGWWKNVLVECMIHHIRTG